MPIDSMTDNVELAFAAGVPVGEPVNTTFSKSYNTFAAVDVKLLINEKVIAEMQNIHASQDEEQVTGFIDYVIFEEDILKKYLFQEAQIVLHAANEYGVCAKLVIEDVFFDKWSFGIALDDMVMTGRLHFKAANIKPWVKV